MKTVKMICSAAILALALSIQTYAGEINTPGYSGEINTPGVTPTEPDPKPTPPSDDPAVPGDKVSPELTTVLVVLAMLF